MAADDTSFTAVLAAFFGTPPEGSVNEHPGPDFDREITAEEIDSQPAATTADWLTVHASDRHPFGFEPEAE